MTLSFRKIETRNRLLNPFRDFSPDEIPSEIRFDPLTGQTGRVFSIPYQSEPMDWTDIVKRSRESFCPFCEDALEKSTPLFPADLIPEGRIRMGGATLIPNLVPFDKYAGVCIMTRSHYVPLEDWNPENMRDAFRASKYFLTEISKRDGDAAYAYINWNFMPPAGSSIVHPHLQPNCGEFPTNEHRLQMEGCRRYREKTGKSFWDDFMEAEKADGARYIGEIDATFWAMSFVPQGFLPDVWCLFRNRRSIIHADENEFEAFLTGLTGVLKFFHNEKISSFNLSIFSVKDDTDFRVNAKICPRLLPRPIGNSDIAYLQMLHKEAFCVRPPESACHKVKEIFQDL